MDDDPAWLLDLEKLVERIVLFRSAVFDTGAAKVIVYRMVNPNPSTWNTHIPGQSKHLCRIPTTVFTQESQMTCVWITCSGTCGRGLGDWAEELRHPVAWAVARDALEMLRLTDPLRVQELRVELLLAGPVEGNEPSANKLAKSTSGDFLSGRVVAAGDSQREMETCGASGEPNPFSSVLFTSCSNEFISCLISSLTSAAGQHVETLEALEGVVVDSADKFEVDCG